MGEQSDNPFQFAGRENDGTGLLFERNRYYSFELARYISEDPIGLAGGDVNYYVRVGNSPLNSVDPMGLREWTIHRKGFSAGLVIFGLKGEKVSFTSNCEDNIKITHTYLVVGVGFSVGGRLTIHGDSEGYLGGRKFSGDGLSPVSGISVSGPSGGFVKGTTFGSATFGLDDSGRLAFGEGHALSTGSIYGASIFSFMGDFYRLLDTKIEKCACP